LIAEAPWNQIDIPRWRAVELVDTVLDPMKETLASVEDVLIKLGRTGATYRYLLYKPKNEVDFLP
jgi:hypothetical protein